MKQFIKNHYGIIVFLAVYFGILAFKVVTHPTPFFDWDESIYMQVGKEMVRHHTLLASFQGQPWLEKPPLAPIFYGLIYLLPGNPDITTRIASIILSLIALWLIYAWITKVTKNKFFALAVTVFTAINPIFFQRAQIVNTDVMLLIGWLGYVLFYDSFWLGFVFLAIGVLSKSLLGFYPVILMFAFETYSYLLKRNKVHYILQIKKMVMQVGLLIIWYIFMLILYGKTFIQIHLEDHLLRRVTSSIESHFGQRTFYLDIIFNEYKWFSLVPFVSLALLTFNFFKKRLKLFPYFLSVFLVPWFLFLNLTKTKIDWYIYPAIPQITFLIFYPFMLLQKYKTIFYSSVILVLAFYIYMTIGPLYNTFYSSYDDNYRLALSAKKQCGSLDLLVDANDRHTDAVLKKLHLLISTSEIYGTHPAIIFYFDKKVNPYYNENSFTRKIRSSSRGSCASLEEKDLPLIQRNSHLEQIGKFGRFYLFERV